ncbi:MAG: hypothetical protein H6754_00180 [Candidatus Omnitrophica bacterium]|nr:hypothetical protein [Candidatus Omnitrophota bacterium]
MKTRKDLCPWIVEALEGLQGSAKIVKVKEYIWDHHGDELRSSGNLHFSWHDDVFWAATQLRAKGVIKKASATSKSVWSLVGHIDPVKRKT